MMEPARQLARELARELVLDLVEDLAEHQCLALGAPELSGRAEERLEIP